MVAINYAKDIRVGEQPVKAAALGSYFVWPPLPERLFLRGQSLVYDFAKQRYGVRLPDDTIDYTTNVNDLGILTRASTATYWGPEGSLLEASVDEARIQHDPVTGEALGLLVESSSTNTAPNSEDFSWVQSSGINGVNYYREEIIPDPSGSYNATRVIKTGSNARFARSNYASGLTRSIYARTVSGEGSVHLLVMGSDSQGQLFDLDENWRRCEIPYVGHNQIHLVDFRGGSTLEEVLIWGFQSEDSPHATTYIPTTDSPVTRVADNAVIDLSDVLNPDEGTFFFVFKAYVGGGEHQYVNFNNAFRLYENTAAANRVEFNWGEGVVRTVRPNAPSGYYSFKIALTYTGQQAQLVVRLGDDVSVFSTETDFRIDKTLYLFNRPQGDRAADGIFKTVEYYPESVSEEELNQMVGGDS